MLKRFSHSRIITLSVIAAHFLFFVFTLMSSSFVPKKKEHKPLIVKTIIPKSAVIEKKSQIPSQLQTPQASKIAAAPPPKPKAQTVAPKKQEILKPQTQAKNKTTPKTPVIKKEPAVADKKLTAPAKKNPPPPPRAKISDSLLQELEESIAKIETKSDKGITSKKTFASSKAFLPTPLQIDKIAADDLNAEDIKSDYTDVLVRHLHQVLSLPDFGEVKIQLSLRQDGTVAKLNVIKAQSEKNKHYLETNLPSLRFPRFEGIYASKKEHTFILTFCNEL